MRQILKKVFLTPDGEKVTTTEDIHKKVNAYRHIVDISNASKVWKISHDLKTTGIQVQVFNQNGNVIIPDKVSIKNSYKVDIEFSQKQSGTALIIGNMLP